MRNYFENYLKDIDEALRQIVVTNKEGKVLNISEGLEIWTDKVHYIQNETKGLLFFCGNGASATMAEHMSHDWFQNGMVNTYTVSETAHLTAISNDISYDEVFSYRIERCCTDRDMLVAISSSGNSTNILKAINSAREKGSFIVTVSGKGKTNTARTLGDLNFYVSLETYGMVESTHAVLLHLALDYFLDKYIGRRH